MAEAGQAYEDRRDTRNNVCLGDRVVSRGFRGLGGTYSLSAETALLLESSGMPGPIDVLIVALVM